jgi:hypothetical protein
MAARERLCDRSCSRPSRRRGNIGEQETVAAYLLEQAKSCVASVVPVGSGRVILDTGDVNRDDNHPVGVGMVILFRILADFR